MIRPRNKIQIGTQSVCLESTAEHLREGPAPNPRQAQAICRTARCGDCKLIVTAWCQGRHVYTCRLDSRSIRRQKSDVLIADWDLDRHVNAFDSYLTSVVKSGPKG